MQVQTGRMAEAHCEIWDKAIVLGLSVLSGCYFLDHVKKYLPTSLEKINGTISVPHIWQNASGVWSGHPQYDNTNPLLSKSEINIR